MRLGRNSDPSAWYRYYAWLLTPVLATSLLAGCTGRPAQAITVPDVGATIAAPAVQSSVQAAPAAPAQPDLRQLRRQLHSYLADQDGTYGVFILDLTTGKGVGINSDKVFPAASTFKLPMSLYILDQVTKGKASLYEKIAYEASDYDEGTGTLQDWVEEGTELTVRELVELAITQSDNIATHMLLRRFPPQNVYAYMKEQLGGKVTHFDEETMGTTPREMATYMMDAHSGQALEDRELQQFLISALENTAFEDRAAAGVPDGVAVAHKIGTLPNVVNDVALVEVPDHPFIISVFSLDVSEEIAPGVISEVTRKVYDFLTSSSL
ncbi:MAG: putative beta-lactamase [Symbiobacteriaceae bacterium]|jgi:beta-lactamase class A|nr:putative beta-lactamase [Symbiobacteriaceae bacterium]